MELYCELQESRGETSRFVTFLNYENKRFIIDPKVYADYAGEYRFEFSADYTLTVGTENSNLTTEIKQPTGQSKAVLYPESETAFFRKDVDIEVIFVKNEAGRVTGLNFRQEGQDLPAKRIK